MQEVDRTLTSRFEFKYLVHHDLLPSLRSYIQPFVKPDRYAAESDDSTYWISSLYLDNSNFRLYRGTVEGHKNRFKLRIRTYSDMPDEPVFFEIKRRNDKVIQKTRTNVDRTNAGLLLENRQIGGIGLPNACSEIPQEFLNLAHRFGARPVVRVKYRREAYEATGSEPLRVTFDTQLSCAPTSGNNFSHNGLGWQTINPGGVILEIKYTGAFPAWVAEMAFRFGLRKQSVPKYIMAVDTAFKPGDPFRAVVTVPRGTTVVHLRGD